jgi:hypothetical protein
MLLLPRQGVDFGIGDLVCLGGGFGGGCKERRERNEAATGLQVV